MSKPPAVRSACLLTPGWPRTRFANGIVSMVHEVAPALRELGCRTTILTANGEVAPGEQDIHKLPPHLSGGIGERIRGRIERRLRPLEAQRLSGARRILSALKHRGPFDLIEMEETYGWAAEVVKRATLPVVVCVHGPWFLHGPLAGFPEDDMFRERVRAEGESLSAAAGVLAPCLDVLDRARAHYGIELQQAEVIPNPVQAAPLSERWSLEGCRRNLILFVGRFDRHKGGDIVIDAFAEVARQLPDARLVFAGRDRGVVDDEGKKWSAEQYIEHRLPGASSSGRVEYTGVLPPEKIAELRKAALVTVSASRYENFAVSVLEALSMGTPLIVADEGGLKEIVRNEENGLVVRAGDSDDLARALMSLLRDPDRAAALGQAAFVRCERELSPRSVATRRLDYYARVLERFGQR